MEAAEGMEAVIDENVHEAKGDILIVMPAPAGWTLRWYIPDCDQPHEYDDERSGDVTSFLGGALGPDADADDEDDDDTDEESEADARDMKCVHQYCASAAVCVKKDDDGDPLYYYWFAREDAQAAADTIMAAVLRARSAPWADAAKAMGWVPPPDWETPPPYRG